MLELLSEVGVRQTLHRVCEDIGQSIPEVKWIQSATALTDAGWHVAEVTVPANRKPREGHLEEHLDKTLARAERRLSKELDAEAGELDAHLSAAAS